MFIEALASGPIGFINRSALSGVHRDLPKGPGQVVIFILDV